MTEINSKLTGFLNQLSVLAKNVAGKIDDAVKENLPKEIVEDYEQLTAAWLEFENLITEFESGLSEEIKLIVR